MTIVECRYNQIVSATEFKAKCLSLLDQIANEGGTPMVTKRGRPLATVERAKKKPFRSSEGILAGKVKVVGDIVNLDTSDLYDVVTKEKVKPRFLLDTHVVVGAEKVFFGSSPCNARS